MKQEQARDRMSRNRPDSDQERHLSRGSTPLPAHHPPEAETTGPGNRGCRNHTACLGRGSNGRKVPWEQSCTLQVEKKQLDASLGEPRAHQSFPETAARSAWEASTNDHGQHGFIPFASMCPLAPALTLVRRSLRHLQLSQQHLVLKCRTRAVTQQLGLSGGHLAGLRPPWLHGPHL